MPRLRKRISTIFLAAVLLLFSLGDHRKAERKGWTQSMVECGHARSSAEERMTDVSFSCYNCGHVMPLLGGAKVLKNDTCSKCDADLHCCRNCRFFDPAVNNQCRETQAEWVATKDRRNYCDYFEASTHITLVKKSGAQADDARKKFDSLFKK